MTDPEWIEGDWEAVKVGDRVRLVFGDDSHEFTVAVTDSAKAIYCQFDRHNKSEGWSLFVQATPNPVLPIEPGCYQIPELKDCYVVLNTNGTWIDGRDGMALPEHYVRDLLSPLGGRLAPVADTAKAVLDRLADRSIRSFVPNAETTYKLFSSDFDKVASEFGVTNDLP